MSAPSNFRLEQATLFGLAVAIASVVATLAIGVALTPPPVEAPRLDISRDVFWPHVDISPWLLSGRSGKIDIRDVWLTGPITICGSSPFVVEVSAHAHNLNVNIDGVHCSPENGAREY